MCSFLRHIHPNGKKAKLVILYLVKWPKFCLPRQNESFSCVGNFSSNDKNRNRSRWYGPELERLRESKTKPSEQKILCCWDNHVDDKTRAQLFTKTAFFPSFKGHDDNLWQICIFTQTNQALKRQVSHKRLSVFER